MSPCFTKMACHTLFLGVWHLSEQTVKDQSEVEHLRAEAPGAPEIPAFHEPNLVGDGLPLKAWQPHSEKGSRHVAGWISKDLGILLFY